MSVSSIAAGSSSSLDAMSLHKQRRSSFQNLFDSVASGDIGSAQKALTTLQQSGALGQQGAGAGSGGDPRRDAFDAMVGAVSAGDVAGAQSALTTLRTAPRDGAANVSSGNAPSSARSMRDTFTSDFASILQAVQAGDMSAAQQAYKTMQGDASALYSPASQPASTSSAAAASAASTGDPLKDDFNSLIASVQSGDTTAAQEALAKLRSDVAARATGKHGHHGHHGHHGGGQLPVPPTASTSTTDPNDPASTATATATAAGGGDTDGDGDGH